MPLKEVRAAGLDAIGLATALLQRARLADATAGVWEAADVQWWWRSPRPSDVVPQTFWLDNAGPVAGYLLTAFPKTWQIAPVVASGAAGIPLEEVWGRGLALADEVGAEPLEILIRDDDHELASLALGSGCRATDERGGSMWLDASDRGEPRPLPSGFTLVDRTERRGQPHPMRQRSGELVEERLRQVSLYDPSLDLSIEAEDGDVAGYALFWSDRVTGVGLLEPMRVHESYQRRGLATALIGAGVERLAARGALRMKVGYSSDAARALYESVGFRPAHTDSGYRRRAEARAGRLLRSGAEA